MKPSHKYSHQILKSKPTSKAGVPPIAKNSDQAIPAIPPYAKNCDGVHGAPVPPVAKNHDGVPR